ncbi:NAD(P)(+) transhydrogenase (Re/Si-specific) subunit beta [Cryobacterium sp. TMS1-13-1]|uniref:NAD(P)(+) transhydrogenase (Re/Si-specific) subunit beta n=1 Tax=Cryobacterium sp. TMS1-13-1 TaxID=1259220 RepID=UPI0010695CD5|nr:NAD(P)(+) transhydrogenase (Re/Si-specific) subunit beta [Cryobacterium sp. TMS1-13-1]TFD22595.1 NAD(P)(+) transhydrogenase (Re/Si-specific) subunit beta [Cryobacterium sp. TMS1-13-1]
MDILVYALYIVAFAMFILGLSGLTAPKSAVRGNKIAAAGMGVAFIATLIHIRETSSWLVIVAALVVGVIIGIPPARKVKMTAVPQLVALFNGVGGGTVALIAWGEFIESEGFTGLRVASGPALPLVIASLFAAIIGSLSFWGSIVAFMKLQQILPGHPLSVGRLQQPLNAMLFLSAIVAAGIVGIGSTTTGADLVWFVAILILAGILGVMTVLPIGGADMPVVISLLNALTGLSAAAAGLALNNIAMIVAGMIVGASGTILTNLMAKAMNRSILSIVAGGFGGGGSKGVSATSTGDQHAKSTSAADAAIKLAYANQVIVVPGYGLAVAQAQHAVKDMAKVLESRGIEVKYAIHPVAGRMPGHMNVLLAEADVSYDAMKEMDDINSEFSRTDVTIVIGANDVTNPAARNDPNSPIFGMPVLNVTESRSVIVLKRSMSSGFAGIENPLFFAANTTMLFGDAKKSVAQVTEELKAL